MGKSLLVGGICLILSGCSTMSQPNYDALGLVQVAGTVTLDGLPLEDVEIRFETPEDGIYSYGVTDTSGRFELMFDSRTPGIIPGRKRIIVVAKQKPESEAIGPSESEEGQGQEEEGADEEGAAVEVPSQSKIPLCYGRKSTFFLNVDGANRSLAIELRSDCSNAGSISP
jgi:hypothetical protein